MKKFHWMQRSVSAAVVTLAAMGATQARAEAVVIGPGTSTHQGWNISLQESSLQVSILFPFLGVMTKAGAAITAVAPVTTSPELQPGRRYKHVTAIAPMTTLSGNLADGQLDVASIKTSGGLRFDVQHNPDNTYSTGGFLSLTDLELDYANRRVYGTVSGGNGIGTVAHANLGPTDDPEFSSLLLPMGGLAQQYSFIPGWYLDQSTMDLFAASLGLTDLGKSSLPGLMGFMNYEIQVLSAVATPVPEPTAGLLAALGVGVAAGLRRRRANHPGH